MENKIRILIADESAEFRAALREYLCTVGAEVVCEAATEAELLAGVSSAAPGIVLTDIWLANSEAVGTIARVKDLFRGKGKAPDFIVFSCCAGKDICAEVIEAGAAYCMPKPLDYAILKERILRLHRKRTAQAHPEAAVSEISKKLEAEVTGTLHKLGVNANIKGYLYLRTAIMLTVEQGGAMSAVTKVLYPTVAKLHDTTPSRVERAMRHAISSAWERGDLTTLHFYFGNTVKPNRGKPTNSEFIAMISDHMRMKFSM